VELKHGNEAALEPLKALEQVLTLRVEQSARVGQGETPVGTALEQDASVPRLERLELLADRRLS